MHVGADMYSYSQHIPRHAAVPHRRNIKLYTKPVYDRDYRRRLCGRSRQKFNCAENTAIGYIPVKFHVDGHVDSYLEIKTNYKNQLYSGTIHAKLREWLKEGTIKYVGNRDRMGEAAVKAQVRVILPFVVEPRKPRWD